MAKTQNDNFQPETPKPLDNRQGYFINGEWKPFPSKTEALNTVIDNRCETLTLPLIEDGKLVEYWFDGGIANENFVKKLAAPTAVPDTPPQIASYASVGTNSIFLGEPINKAMNIGNVVIGKNVFTAEQRDAVAFNTTNRELEIVSTSDYTGYDVIILDNTAFKAYPARITGMGDNGTLQPAPPAGNLRYVLNANPFPGAFPSLCKVLLLLKDVANKDGAVAIGHNSVAYGKGAVAIGLGSYSSGDGSAAVGSKALATGNGSFAAGTNSIAKGENSLALGGGQSLGQKGMAIGDGSYIPANVTYGFTFGMFCNDRAGNGALATGNLNDTFGVYSFVHGKYSKTDFAGERVQGIGKFFGSGNLSVKGQAQEADNYLALITTDATPTRLTLDDGARFYVRPQLAKYKIDILAKEQNGAKVAVFEINVSVLKQTGANAVILGTPTITVIHRTVGTWDAQISLDNSGTSKYLDITVTGEAATTIKWFATINSKELWSIN